MTLFTYIINRHCRGIISLIVLISGGPVFSQHATESARSPKFVKHIITNDFISEGVAIGDVNHDGKLDILAGAYWFEAPGWIKHELAAANNYDPRTGYSNSFLNYAMDVNQDGWIDLIRISLPGEEAVWYENPKNKSGRWRMYPIISNAGNESPAFVDVDGDGREDILCNDPVAKEMIWLKSPSKKGDTLWQKMLIASGNIPGTGRYTHGLGWSDMNADGRPDVIITKGWWETPEDRTKQQWLFHPADFGEDCSQIYTLDVKGDGKLGLVSASAHDYGIWWHEKVVDEKGNEVWQHHLIYNKISETHGMAMADINGDGHPDLITGKRFFAHNEKDPGALEPSMLYWFEFKPGIQPTWIPHQIDDDSGVGLQVIVRDINHDGLLDIIISNKKGLFFFEQSKK